MIYKEKGLQNECNLYEWRNVDNQMETRETYERESYQVRARKGKKRKFTRELKIGLIEFEGTENEIAENANLCMLE